MAWGMKDIGEQRVRFVVAVSRREKPLAQLCREFEISRPTGYVWSKRYRERGIAGLEEHSRRPQHSPRQTAEVIEQRVIELRSRWPDWGARKISILLEQEGVRLPASTVHRIFLRHHLVREQDRHAQAVKRFEREAPNQLWQMDFKGPKGWDEPVGPLSVLDDHSRYVALLQRTGSTQAEGVQRALERTFCECGVPEEMLMDHGTPWCNGQGYRGWSKLAVWLMNQDIALHFSGLRHPQTQGKVERFHGSMVAALLRRGTPAPGTATSLARPVSLRAQLSPPPRSFKDENAGPAMAEEWQAVPASSGAMALSLGNRGGRSGPQRLDPHGRPTLVPHADTGRPSSRCNCRGATILSSLSAYTDRRNRPAPVPIHGRGSGLSGLTRQTKV